MANPSPDACSRAIALVRERGQSETPVRSPMMAILYAANFAAYSQKPPCTTPIQRAYAVQGWMA